MSRSGGAGSSNAVYLGTMIHCFPEPPEYIHDDELLDAMKGLELFDDEEIRRIVVYSEALKGMGGPGVFHAYIVIETERWWWSFERTGEGTAVQRSANLSDVALQYQRVPRKWASKIIEDVGCDKMYDLIGFLDEHNLVGSHYYILKNNCKDFAKAIFDRFAKKKHWNKKRLNLFGHQWCL